ncbi:MAG: FAD-dependent oxidoreductase, partial [Candidatus Rokubacteria bacterium]|nr:FAD-dependent oxidoreductase [Candidatus Rokubacteria bacterium]
MNVDLAVVGAGVAGLAAARAARALSPGARVVVLERSGRAGGLVETERTGDGLLVEHGAVCLVTTKPEGLRALGSLGLGDAIVPGSTKQSFIATGGALVPLPPGLFAPSWTAASAILRSPLFSAQAKARILAEPLVPQRAGTEDESVASFVRRRFGAELLERAIGPLLSLIHGTPMERL